MTTTERLVLPRFTAPERRRGVPLVAVGAPVVVAGIIWLVTQLPMVLLFAALGPVVAAAGAVDARLQHRRDLRDECRRVDRALAEAERALAAAHGAERLDRRSSVLDPLSVGAGDPDPALMWRAAGGSAGRSAGEGGGVGPGDLSVVLGAGTVRSRLPVESPSPSERVPARIVERLRALASRAADLEDAPVMLDPSGGLAVVGPRIAATAVTRSLVLQLAAALHPAQTVVRAPAGEDWLGGLPHAVEPCRRAEHHTGEVQTITFAVDDIAVATVHRARRLDQVPPGVRTIVVLGGVDPVRVEIEGRVQPAREIRAVMTSHRQAEHAAERLALLAEQSGARPAAVALPARVAFGELVETAVDIAGSVEPLRDDAAVAGLPARIGMGAGGPCEIDLVRDGPHAVVGGTTGSGKSELLVSWVLSMAAVEPPTRVTFLLVDFKGGAAFAPLAGLPHVVGTLSDLDGAVARRAVSSLRAEVLRRERLLAEHRVRSIAELPPHALPRLVIVVDEYAVMVAEQPELQPLFADLSARGRSLGLHLLLCTQRPAAAVRDAVLSNTAIRISLRAGDRSESIALIGTDAAAGLPAATRGRALLAIAGGPPEPMQVAIADADDVARVAQRHRDAPAPWRPWRDPLPDRIAVAEVPLVADASSDAEPGPRVCFGLEDRPEHQAVVMAAWRPDREGSMLVLGGPSSGRTTALAALAAEWPGPVAWAPVEPADAWALVQALVVRVRSAGTPHAEPMLLVVDDLDRLLSRVSEEQRVALAAGVAALAHGGPDAHVRVAASARMPPSGSGDLPTAFPARLMLPMPTRDEHLAAGGSVQDFDSGAPPGRGRWQGHDVQVVTGAVPPSPTREPVARVRLGADRVAVVAAAPLELAATLLQRGVPVEVIGEEWSAPSTAPTTAPTTTRPPSARVIHVPLDPPVSPPTPIGDVDAWQSSWSRLTAARRAGPLLFLGCAPADVRALTRSRAVPPPLGGPAEGWLVVGSEVRRVAVDAPAGG